MSRLVITIVQNRTYEKTFTFYIDAIWPDGKRTNQHHQWQLQIEICDISGRSVMLEKFYNVEPGEHISLNVTSIRKGIYLCRMISGKQIIGVEKFSK